MSGTSRPWLHELRNQIGIIVGFSEMLLEDVDPADPRFTDVREIHAAALRALQLVSEPPAPEDP